MKASWFWLILSLIQKYLLPMVLLIILVYCFNDYQKNQVIRLARLWFEPVIAAPGEREVETGGSQV
jgi:hypothetical protein